MVNTTISEAYDINYLHKAFGHCGTETLKNTARIYGFRFTGQFEVCEDCAIAKARQKNVNKVWSGSSNIPGERFFVDRSSIQKREALVVPITVGALLWRTNLTWKERSKLS
jgi:hypothetical protein